jgi:hypothetical protein
MDEPKLCVSLAGHWLLFTGLNIEGKWLAVSLNAS